MALQTQTNWHKLCLIISSTLHCEERIGFVFVFNQTDKKLSTKGQEDYKLTTISQNSLLLQRTPEQVSHNVELSHWPVVCQTHISSQLYPMNFCWLLFFNFRNWCRKKSCSNIFHKSTDLERTSKMYSGRKFFGKFLRFL